VLRIPIPNKPPYQQLCWEKQRKQQKLNKNAAENEEQPRKCNAQLLLGKTHSHRPASLVRLHPPKPRVMGFVAAPPAPLLEDPRHWCVFTHQAACHGIGSGTSYATTRSGLNIPAKSAKPLWFQKRQNPRKTLPQKIRFWPDFTTDLGRQKSASHR